MYWKNYKSSDTKNKQSVNRGETGFSGTETFKLRDAETCVHVVRQMIR